MAALVDGDLATEVEEIDQDAVRQGRTFEQFFTEMGLLSVPHDFSEDLATRCGRWLNEEMRLCQPSLYLAFLFVDPIFAIHILARCHK